MEVTNNKKWCVYIHTNKINNKAYIGITSKDPKKRWSNGMGYGNDQSIFHKAIQKYGWDNFEHIIWAENLSEDEAKHLEIILIALFKTNCCKYKNPEYGYNMTDGGDGTLGRECTEETKVKIGIANRGRIPSEETRKKMSQSQIGEKNHNYGRLMSDDQKQKLSERAKERYKSPENHPMYGKHFSQESKDKMIESQIKKQVVQLNKIGEFIAEFVSINEAARQTNISRLHISRCCNHIPHHNTAGGYRWLFKTEYDKILTQQNDLIIENLTKEEDEI